MAKDVGKKLFVSGFSLVLALVTLEVGTRILLPQSVGGDAGPLLRGEFVTPGDHPHVSPAGEFRVTVHVNSEGFVDKEWGPKEGPRVVFIGDSFVQSAQVLGDQRFGPLIEAATGIDVLSMGVPGAGQGTALGVLQTYALARDPDLVVLSLFVANDIMNNHALLEGKDNKPFYAIKDGELVQTDAATSLEPGLLFSMSHFWRFATRTMTKKRIMDYKLELGKGMPIDLRLYDPAGGELWEEAWAITDGLVAKMAEDCKAAGVPFATVVVPDAVIATPAGRAQRLGPYPETADWDVTRPQARAVKLASQHGKVYDLLPAMREAPNADELYLPLDGHWTVEGHKVVAAALGPWLQGVLAAEGTKGPASPPLAPPEAEQAAEVEEGAAGLPQGEPDGGEQADQPE